MVSGQYIRSLVQTNHLSVCHQRMCTSFPSMHRDFVAVSVYQVVKSNFGRLGQELQAPRSHETFCTASLLSSVQILTIMHRSPAGA